MLASRVRAARRSVMFVLVAIAACEDATDPLDGGQPPGPPVTVHVEGGVNVDAYFFSAFEAQARQNLQRSIRHLGG